MLRISGVQRGICSPAAMAITGLLPLILVGAPTPSPGPETFLLPAPEGYTVANVPTPHGHFTANALAANFGTKTSEAMNRLAEDGFVDGYGYVWLDNATHRELIEYVVAFSGARGANDWLNYGKGSDESDPAYKHADSISGIGTYFGEHYVYPSHDVGDYFIFVKGNDLFGVGFTSRNDDVLSLARAQAKRQYDAAPPFTIPPKDWPENAAHPSPSSPASSLITVPQLGVLLGAILLVVAGAIVILLVRSRRLPVIQGQPPSSSPTSEAPPPGS